MNAKLIVCASALLLLVISCSLGFEDIKPRGIQDVNESILGEEIGLQFPDETKLIKFHETDFVVDNAWHAKFEIIESNKKIIIESIEQYETVKYKLNTQQFEELDWWKVGNPDYLKKYRYDNSTIVMLMISTELNQVYLYVKCIII